MITDIKVEDDIYHKYLGSIKVVDICDTGLVANCGIKGNLEFKNFDFGKVLFKKKSHTINNFDSFEEYEIFCYNEKIDGIKKNEEIAKEIEERRIFEEEKAKKIEKANIAFKKVVEQKIEILNEKNNSKDKLFIENNESGFHIIGKYICTNKQIEAEKKRLITNKTIIIERNHQERAIRQILNDRHISCFLHFTRVENLCSILEQGLVPVMFHEYDGVKSICNDCLRLDSKLDRTSLSIEFPNHKLFKKFRDYLYPGERWAIIAISPEVLFSCNNVSYFYHSNAAGSKTNLDGLYTAEAFENMFCESVTKKDGAVINRLNLRIQDNMTTDPQAEILISHSIEKVYISNVFFHNIDDYSYFNIKTEDRFAKKYTFKIKPELFNPRND